ncbi:COP9 signalosome complex subunit 5b [Hordeum vulgare]|nr:COP9 signalosome complex subunit 5b [Hordeum vulgare]
MLLEHLQPPTQDTFLGKVEGTTVLKAICASFKETTEPHVCMTQELCSYNLITVAVFLTDRFISSVVVTDLYDLVADMEMDECLHNWRDEKTNLTASRDTYMGRVCECPAVDVVQYDRDGYMKQISYHLLDLLWNKYWVNTLSSSPLLGNMDYVARQIFDLGEALGHYPHHFRRARISAHALLRMVVHARAGGTIEIMGLIKGKFEGDSIIVMDTFALPVKGTETRVNAQADAYEYMV